ncbi:unnamed protein product [Ectocarpus sp. 12 AP-2014]
MHPEIEDRLTSMSRRGDIQHLLFHGPRGSGKMTLVRHLLEGLYGPGVKQVTTEKRVVETASAKQTIEIDVLVSNYHIEVEPSDAGADDTYVVQQAIKEMGNNGSIAAVFGERDVTHKTIVLRGAGNISKQAQAGLRRTMEKFTGSCRLILVSTSASRVIEPLRSRCVSVRVPLPSAGDLAAALREKKVDDASLVDRIVESSGRSISRAMYMAKSGNADRMPWVKYIESVCRGVFLEQSPRKLIDVRDSLNELLAAGVPASVVIKTLTHELVGHPSLDGEDGVKRDIVKCAAVYEHRVCVGSRNILHMEAFVASFMDLYKRHTVSQFS